MLRFFRKFLWNWRYLPVAVIVLLLGTPIVAAKWISERIDDL